MSPEGTPAGVPVRSAASLVSSGLARGLSSHLLFPTFASEQNRCAVHDHEQRIGVLRELLVELDRLAAAQRAINLRDLEALERHGREVERVRRRIDELGIKEPV